MFHLTSEGGVPIYSPHPSFASLLRVHDGIAECLCALTDVFHVVAVTVFPPSTWGVVHVEQSHVVDELDRRSNQVVCTPAHRADVLVHDHAQDKMVGSFVSDVSQQMERNVGCLLVTKNA